MVPVITNAPSSGPCPQNEQWKLLGLESPNSRTGSLFAMRTVSHRPALIANLRKGEGCGGGGGNQENGQRMFQHRRPPGRKFEASRSIGTPQRGVKLASTGKY